MKQKVHSSLNPKSCLIFGAAILCGFPGGASATEAKPPPLDWQLGFEWLKNSVKALPSVKQSEAADWEVLQVGSPRTSKDYWWIAQYVFTKRYHYAYPTVTRRILWEDASGAVLSKRTACGCGPKPLFDKVMREFEDLDIRMTEAIENERR